MGTGIALVAARQNVAGKVFLFDAYQSSLDNARSFAENWVQKEISKNRLSETEGAKILADTLQFAPGNDWSSAAELMAGTGELDFAIEAVSESLSLKQEIYRDLVSKFGFGSQGANRVLMPYINEAVFCLQEQISTREDIDKIMKQGTNVPMGPLTLADFIGLDTCLSIMRVLHAELGDSKYRPAPLLVNYVEAGWLGKKVGRGFYEY
eukprot:g9630.t1